MQSGETELSAALGEHREWICTDSRGASVSLRAGDWNVFIEYGRLFFSYWTSKGTLVWRVVTYRRNGSSLVLEVARLSGAERTRLELVPRAAAQTAVACVKEARLARAARLATLFCPPGARIIELGLSQTRRPTRAGRYARIIIAHASERLAIAGPITNISLQEADSFLAASLGWFARLRERKQPVERFALAVGPLIGAAMAKRLALLRDEWQKAICLFEVDERGEAVHPLPFASLADLLANAVPLQATPSTKMSRTAQKLLALAPEAIDVVRTRGGETLRFHGLPFARVRRVVGCERAWFGVGTRRVLDEESWPELVRLIAELKEHRRADALFKHHALYRAAPEAWLESLLRRKIDALDPGLKLSPLHAQLRTPRDAEDARPVDLVAQRKDGRIVVIELKAHEDPGIVLQGADYWRRVEAQRRAGHLSKLFPDAPIADLPAIVYLAAPTLCFSKNAQRLARLIDPRLEIYRLDLNEDWRVGVRVARRTLLTVPD
ncbi:MAG: hypothetical protein C4334_10765 [Pyrinomonas sp.]|uniref:hypothetical protein n=1 Tax=Pyrinomonas sp. TaxID=2080306 RepID=UPI00332C4072